MYESRIKCDKSAFTSCVRIFTQQQQTKKVSVSVFKQIKMSTAEITKIVAKSLFSIYVFFKYEFLDPNHETVKSQLLRQAQYIH